MFDLNTISKYTLLLILSTGKRNFSELARTAKESVYNLKKSLYPSALILRVTRCVAQYMFEGHKELVLSIDDTLINKFHSRFMMGAGRFFDTKLGRKIMAYRLMVGALTNGKHTIPIDFGFMFDKDLVPKGTLLQTKLDFIQKFLLIAQDLFPQAHITIAADGLFSTQDILRWATENDIRITARMQKNRRVLYQGKEQLIKDIPELVLKGRQMARTIQVLWHNIPLFITAEKRIDKHGNESIVYLASTYAAKPAQYVAHYKKRWPIEKTFRTAKQSLGLAGCASTDKTTQENHVAAVLFAYALVQLEQWKQKLDTPEKAIRYIKTQNMLDYQNSLTRFREIFHHAFS